MSAPAPTVRPGRRPAPPSPRRGRTLAIVAGVLGGIVVLVVAIVAFGSGGGDSSTVTHQPVKSFDDTVELAAGDVTADSAGPAAALTPEQANAVLGVLDSYVNGASLEPLRSGKPTTADLSAVFDPGTLARVSGADRAVALDEGLPAIAGRMKVKADPVAMVALGDQTGTVVLVSTNLHYTVETKTAAKAKPVVVDRTAQLVLSPDLAGSWKVTAYDIGVQRTGSGLGPVPTTTVAP